MGSEPADDNVPANDATPEPSTGFKISSILWAVALVGIALLVASQAVLIMGTKANSHFGTVGVSIGSTVTTGSR